MGYDIIIIGAGVMGTSSAYYLSKKGKKVLLLDQYAVENDINSSQDYSRAFRYEYGDDEFYTNLAVESLKLWKQLEIESNKKLYFQCGSLLLGETEDDYATRSFNTLKKLGHKVDRLSKEDLNNRYPQFSSKFAVFDYHGGILAASSAVKAFIGLAKKNGVEIREKTKVNAVDDHAVILEDGIKLEGRKIVITSGVWVNKLLNISLSIKAAKQQLVYFKPKNLDRFRKEVFPMFAYLDQGFYGFPIHGIKAVKISNHTPGEIVEPLTVDRTVNETFIKECREFFSKFIPELADSEVIKTKVCLYDMSPNEDFLVDRLNEDVVVATGFSGHGFKFAPLIGKMVGDLILNKEINQEYSRFKLRS